MISLYRRTFILGLISSITALALFKPKPSKAYPFKLHGTITGRWSSRDRDLPCPYGCQLGWISFDKHITIGDVLTEATLMNRCPIKSHHL